MTASPYTTIFTTDEQLLDLLTVAELKNRLNVLNACTCPPRYRIALQRAIASR